MSDSTASLRRKISSAGELQSVVRTMKALSASSIGQYERAVRALTDYYRAVELGLGVCFRGAASSLQLAEAEVPSGPDTIVFGSDQGLVGQFNDAVAECALRTLAGLPGEPQVWAVGERVYARLLEAGLPMRGLFDVPNSVEAISSLITQIQLETDAQRFFEEDARVYVFHNQPRSGAVYEPVAQRLLPLDAEWRRELIKSAWPSKNLPEVLGSSLGTLRALIREYLFISLFRACAGSLASENASRLAAMERAEKNIGELLEDLNGNFRRLRQSGIDSELFDLISGFEALAGHGRA
jgi:F-type H+-transporting ATPase subunit gamma